MIPTRDGIKALWRGIFDDPNGRVFTDSVFDASFPLAYDALFQGLLWGQCPKIKNIAVVQVAPGTTSLTPAVAGIADFADYVMLRERAAGSTERFIELDSREQLTQRVPVDRLLEFVWRGDAFYFIGATSLRDLEITYESSGTAPTGNVQVGVDGCQTFLANFCAGVSGRRKGYEEIGKECMQFAVGPKYDLGIIGGELFRVVQAKVRSEQKTQVAPRPYSVFRRGALRRQVPYVAAQQPAGVGTAPVQFSTADGTITGTIDGVNALFYLSYPVATLADLTVNGVTMTKGSDYVHGFNVITFQAASIPQPSSDSAIPTVITALGWV